MDYYKTEYFKKLTWSDIRAWAGDIIASRGKSYQQEGSVEGLAVTSRGELVAWVQGTERYATVVDIKNEWLISACTCPYEGTCKHAVAVVLDYLERLKLNKQVPTIRGNDKRLLLLGMRSGDDLEAGGDNEEDTEREEIQPDVTGSPVRERTGSDLFHSYLEKQDKEQLIRMLETIARYYPAARSFLIDQYRLSLGEVERLVQSTSKEIDRLSARPGWRHSWDGEEEGEFPDYSEVRFRMEMLLSRGYADEVVTLGKRLLEAGIRQVEESDDGGETQGEIASCMDIVFQALSKTSLSGAEQMLWAVEADLKDHYEITTGSDIFWEQDHQPGDWNILADTLLERLEKTVPAKESDHFKQDYDRGDLAGWIVTALENAGRQEEVLPFLEEEAAKTGSYVSLVEHLIQAGLYERAEQWIYRGVQETQQSNRGIAYHLRECLRKMREQQGDWLFAAALRSDDFQVSPDVRAFEALHQVAEKAGVWPAVRAAVMHYMETGELPERVERKYGDRIIPPWPLPDTCLRKKIDNRMGKFPLAEILLDIAIKEKQPEEVLRWFDCTVKENNSVFWTGYPYDKGDNAAEIVKEAYPERSMDIWKKMAEYQIQQARPSAYDRAGLYLRKLRNLYKSLGKEDEWQDYTNKLRSVHFRKVRFLEVLSSLSDKPIIEQGRVQQGLIFPPEDSR
jgi:uncharacterized Zn finger protein